MRKLVPAALLLVVVAAIAVVLLTREGEKPYKVRAIFDNAGFVIPGEDVKVAGVKVGKIDSLDVTEDFKAVVVLDIKDKAYQDFRRDAECQIRPQSLIGEKFVECTPGSASAPALREIEDGEGEAHGTLGRAGEGETERPRGREGRSRRGGPGDAAQRGGGRPVGHDSPCESRRRLPHKWLTKGERRPHSAAAEATPWGKRTRKAAPPCPGR